MAQHWNEERRRWDDQREGERDDHRQRGRHGGSGFDPDRDDERLQHGVYGSRSEQGGYRGPYAGRYASGGRGYGQGEGSGMGGFDRDRPGYQGGGDEDRGQNGDYPRYGRAGGTGGDMGRGMGGGMGRGGQDDRHGASGMRGEHYGRGPRGYTRSDDRIREDVNDRLTDDSHLDATNIDVEVKNCEVTLGGTVDSREAKRHAEDIAESVSGVRHVQNNIRVQQQQHQGQDGNPLSQSASQSASSQNAGGLSAGTGKSGGRNQSPV